MHRAHIEQRIAAGGSNSLTFTLPTHLGGTRYLEVELTARSDGPGALVQVALILNNDFTAGNYDSQLLYAQGTGAVGVEAIGSRGRIPIGYVSGAGSSAGALWSWILARIIDFRDTARSKVVTAQAAGMADLAAGSILPSLTGAVYEPTAAITAVTVQLASGNFVAGSVADLHAAW